MAIRQNWDRGLFSASPEGEDLAPVHDQLLTKISQTLLDQGLFSQSQAFLKISAMGNFLSQQAEGFFKPVFDQVFTAEQRQEFEQFLGRRDAFRLWQEKLDLLSSPVPKDSLDDSSDKSI